MKKVISVCVVLLSSLAAVAQQQIKSDQLANFNTVDLIGKLSVELIPAAETSIDITLNNADISKLNWTVKNGSLEVKLKPSTGGSADVKIYYKQIDVLLVNGAVVTVKEPIVAVMFDLNLLAGSSVIADIQAKDLMVKAAGNSILTLNGEATYLTIQANSKAKVDTRGMEVVSADVSATSGAEVYVVANDRLRIASDIGASVYYKGEPVILRTVKKLMGNINNIGK